MSDMEEENKLSQDLSDYRTPEPVIDSQEETEDRDSQADIPNEHDIDDEYDVGCSGWSGPQYDNLEAMKEFHSESIGIPDVIITKYKCADEVENYFKAVEKFHSDAIAVIEDNIKYGYSDKPYPEMPTINLEQIIETVGQSISTAGQIAEKAPVEKPTGKTKGMKRSSTSNKKECKKAKVDWKNMSAIDFNKYLKTLLRPQSSNANREKVIQQSIMPTDNIEEMAVFLKQSYKNIRDDETVLMSKQLQLGKDLLVAQARYSHFKIESKSKTTWAEWLESNTDISVSYARQVKLIAKLVQEFPKLKDLQISFTCMREMMPKIKSVFTSNQKIALEWK